MGVSGNKSLPCVADLSGAHAERRSPSASQVHDWQRQPPKLTARDVARSAGIDPEPAHLVDPLQAALSVRSRETIEKAGAATDERDVDTSWAITITIAGLAFTVGIRWQVRRSWKRWLIGCAGCDKWKRAVYLVDGRLQCRECAGVRVPDAACPSILKPVKALSRVEAEQLAERQRRRERRKWARIAGAQVFTADTVGCRVAQTFAPDAQVQSDHADTDD